MPDRVLTRRTAIATTLSAAAIAGIAGCDIDPPAQEPAPRGGDADRQGTPPSPAASDIDRVHTVVETTAAAAALVEAVRVAVPGLDAALAPLAAAQAAHLALLAEAVPDAPVEPADAPRVPARTTPALRRVGRELQSLERRVRDAAVACESGDLARVLASIAAATAQHASAVSAPARPGEVP